VFKLFDDNMNASGDSLPLYPLGTNHKHCSFLNGYSLQSLQSITAAYNTRNLQSLCIQEMFLMHIYELHKKQDIKKKKMPLACSNNPKCRKHDAPRKFCHQLEELVQAYC
jgi:hypothetical protein